MKISYAITVYNELNEIIYLIEFLKKTKRPKDEIVVLFDDKGPDQVWKYLQSQEQHINLHPANFNNDFAEWKNKLNKLCNGDYIFQIDADEVPNELLVENLHIILENNESDIILIPRVNIVRGITPQHLQAWGWKQNEKGWVQWPDHQWRIYKNTPEIKWKNKLHEVLDGYNTYANLPEMEEYALYHYKTIERQEKQNHYYSKL
jgi:glycosyltransferase involved in cell wall biosynthesis